MKGYGRHSCLESCRCEEDGCQRIEPLSRYQLSGPALLKRIGGIPLPYCLLACFTFVGFNFQADLQVF